MAPCSTCLPLLLTCHLANAARQCCTPEDPPLLLLSSSLSNTHLLALLPLCLVVSHLCQQQLPLLCKARHVLRHLVKPPAQLHHLIRKRGVKGVAQSETWWRQGEH